MHHWTGSSLVQVMACRLFGAKPLPEPMLTYCQFVPFRTNFSKIVMEVQTLTKMHLKMSTQWWLFCLSLNALMLRKVMITRRSENDNTPQPLDQWTNSPFIGQQDGNCKSFTLTHYLADLFAMHCCPRSISLCIQHHIQLTSLSFQVSRPSHS